MMDVDTAEVHPETPNTFGRNLLRRLGIAHDKLEAEAASTSPTSDYTNGFSNTFDFTTFFSPRLLRPHHFITVWL